MNRMPAWRIIFPLFMGTLLEWYDFTLFATLAPILSSAFFPSTNTMASLLSVYGLFAASYLIRPLGAVVLGYYGDRAGRKKVLVVAMAAISLATVGIGLLPTFAAIGVFAPILLILLRLLQGFCVGAETSSSIVFVLESFATGRRGMLGSLVWSAVGIGILLAGLVTTLVSGLLTDSAFKAWGWRIPFLLGIFSGIAGLLLRRKIPETTLFEASLRQRGPTTLTRFGIIRTHRAEILRIFGLNGLSALITYIVFIFMPLYATTVLGLGFAIANGIATTSIAAVTILLPLAGLLSDALGRRPCLAAGASGFMLFSYPLYMLMTSHPSATTFAIAESIFVVFASLYQGALNTTTQELTTTPVRCTVTATGYNTAYAIFGGTAPLVITWMLGTLENQSMPGLYLALGGALALLCILPMRETARQALA